MTQLLTLAAQAFGADDGAQILKRDVEVVVDDEVVVLAIVRHFADRLGHTPGDDVIAVLPATVQTARQLLARRRQNEDAAGLRHLAAHLAGALPVDIEENIDPLRQNLFNRLTRGAIVVAKDFGVLQEIIAGDHCLELVHRDKVVMLTVLFARTAGARGVRDGNPGVVGRLRFQQGLDQAGFASAARRGNDIERTLYHVYVLSACKRAKYSNISAHYTRLRRRLQRSRCADADFTPLGLFALRLFIVENRQAQMEAQRQQTGAKAGHQGDDHREILRYLQV